MSGYPDSDREHFLNRLKILRSIDQHELIAADVTGLCGTGADSWSGFREDPYRWLMRADDSNARKVWGIIRERE